MLWLVKEDYIQHNGLFALLKHLMVEMWDKKHMTVMTHITFGCNSDPIKKCLRQDYLFKWNNTQKFQEIIGKVVGNYIEYIKI